MEHAIVTQISQYKKKKIVNVLSSTHPKEQDIRDNDQSHYELRN